MCIRDSADTESVNNGILNFLVVESKESKVKLIVYMYYIAKNQKIVSY